MKSTTKVLNIDISFCENCPACEEISKHEHDLDPNYDCAFYKEPILDVDYFDDIKPDFCKVKKIQVQTTYFEESK